MNTQKVGNFIYEERKKMNLTQKQLADILNVTDKAVSRWETGKGYPDIEILLKISEVFNISVNELLNGEKISSDKISEKADEQIIIAYRKENKTKKKSKFVISIILVLSIIFCFFFANKITKQLNTEEKIISSYSTELVQLTDELSNILEKQYNFQFYDVFAQVICTNFSTTITLNNKVKIYEIQLIDIYNRKKYDISYSEANQCWNIIKTKLRETNYLEGVQINSIFNMIRSVDFVNICEKNYLENDEYNEIIIDCGNKKIFTGRDATIGFNMYLFDNDSLMKVENAKNLNGTYYDFAITPITLSNSNNEVFKSCCNIYVKG